MNKKNITAILVSALALGALSYFLFRGQANCLEYAEDIWAFEKENGGYQVYRRGSYKDSEGQINDTLLGFGKYYLVSEKPELLEIKDDTLLFPKQNGKGRITLSWGRCRDTLYYLAYYPKFFVNKSAFRKQIVDEQHQW